MKLHGSAALSLRQRQRTVLRVIEQGWALGSAAADVGERTCAKWVARHRVEGESGLGSQLGAPEVANRTEATASGILTRIRDRQGRTAIRGRD